MIEHAEDDEGRGHWAEHERRHRGGRRKFGPGSGFPGGRGFGPARFEVDPDDPEFLAEGGFEAADDEFRAPGRGGPPHFRRGRGFGGMPAPGGGVPGFGGMPRTHGGPPGYGPWSPGMRRRGARAKRGDVRAAALALLAEEPLNGYQIIQQIGERSGGLWRPSPGSVYPALAQLEDENLITAQGAEAGRRAYALTEEGRAYVAAHADELKAPWSAMSGDAVNAAADMRALVHQVHLAAFQVVSAGSDNQVSQARTVLTQARRALYRILAEEEAPEGGTEARD